MLEPCLLQPCFHVAGHRFRGESPRGAPSGLFGLLSSMMLLLVLVVVLVLLLLLVVVVVV